jgi:hypothetical protein
MHTLFGGRASALGGTKRRARLTKDEARRIVANIAKLHRRPSGF